MSVTRASIEMLAAELGRALLRRRRIVTTAESCTGGLVAGAITSIAGSSEWFEQAFVTYGNEAKQALLHVPAKMLERHGAVSEPVARAMAKGALARSRADFAVAITGIAGPGGGSVEKPVGTVWFAFGGRRGPVSTLHRVFSGNRRAVRDQSVAVALKLLIGIVKKSSPATKARA